ncbi:hypothetical protein RHMOL_Rhmol11G0257300 [Rhododendron molle]|uniref:Uncharacterized protein n=1 Tax=Rhododendron molle TaxID=49168 RepID=A0ACC0LWI7_RHOML|nr:hypothetical protein RHMOL_Rhmol11G0257300 [Rhododendron molle]
MGNHMTKPSEASTPTTTTTINFTPHNIHLKTDLDSYEDACRLDQDLQNFDATLQARTNQVITSLAAGVEVKALSFDSLKEVTECLLEMNQEVVKVILECKQDIWKTPELFELVEEYFENSLQTLDFCTALEKCLKRARDSQLLILVALGMFDEESGMEGKKYVKTLEELKKFKAAGDPFTDEFTKIFQSVYSHQTSMLDKLQTRRKKLDKKLRTTQTWRRVSSMIFAATVTAVLICSVVAAAIAAPPVAAALAAASAVPLGSMGAWIDSLWKKYEDAVKGQKDVVRSMEVGTLIVIKDLDNIRVVIERLEIQIESLLGNVDFVIEEEAVKIGIEEIKKKMEVFRKNVDDLGIQTDMCIRDVRRARTVILRRLINPPNP